MGAGRFGICAGSSGKSTKALKISLSLSVYEHAAALVDKVQARGNKVVIK